MEVALEQRDRLVAERPLHPADAVVAEKDTDAPVAVVLFLAKLVEQAVDQGGMARCWARTAACLVVSMAALPDQWHAHLIDEIVGT